MMIDGDARRVLSRVVSCDMQTTMALKQCEQSVDSDGGKSNGRFLRQSTVHIEFNSLSNSTIDVVIEIKSHILARFKSKASFSITTDQSN